MTITRWRDALSRHRLRTIVPSLSRHRAIAPSPSFSTQSSMRASAFASACKRRGTTGDNSGKRIHRHRVIAPSISRHRFIAPSRYHHRVIAPSLHHAIAPSRNRHRAIAPSRYRAIVIAPSHHRVIVSAWPYPDSIGYRKVEIPIILQMDADDDAGRTSIYTCIAIALP